MKEKEPSKEEQKDMDRMGQKHKVEGYGPKLKIAKPSKPPSPGARGYCCWTVWGWYWGLG